LIFNSLQYYFTTIIKEVQMKSILSLIMLLPLIGCAVTSKVLINEEGKQVHCGTWGFGIIGTAVAVSNYQECVNQQKAFGFVDLKDFEKTEQLKIETSLGIKPPKEGRPHWETGYVWTYHLSGTKSGSSRQEVIGKDLVKGLTAYVIRAGESKVYFSEELHTIQVQENGRITATHIPPLSNYDWPLTVGKTWDAKGELETAMGKLNTSTNFEVKGYGIVRVPAGEFEAFYLLSKSDQGSRVSEVWYSPKVRRHVKIVNYTKEGRLTAELSSYSLGPALASPQVIPSQQRDIPPQISTPPPSSLSVRQEILAESPSVTRPATSGGPWLGVPLGSPDQQTLERFRVPSGRGAMVLPFTRNPKMPPVDLEPGDMILAIDGIEVEGPGHVSALLAGKSPGTTIQVRTFRSKYQGPIEQPMVILQPRP